jgi:hypothetical protein
MLLLEAKRWQGLYLIFETKEEHFPEPYLWMDMGEAFWDAAIRLVDYGGENFLDPPSLPDEDVRSCFLCLTSSLVEVRVSLDLYLWREYPRFN